MPGWGFQGAACSGQRAACRAAFRCLRSACRACGTHASRVPSGTLHPTRHAELAAHWPALVGRNCCCQGRGPWPLPPPAVRLLPDPACPGARWRALVAGPAGRPPASCHKVTKKPGGEKRRVEIETTQGRSGPRSDAACAARGRACAPTWLHTRAPPHAQPPVCLSDKRD